MANAGLKSKLCSNTYTCQSKVALKNHTILSYLQEDLKKDRYSWFFRCCLSFLFRCLMDVKKMIRYHQPIRRFPMTYFTDGGTSVRVFGLFH